MKSLNIKYFPIILGTSLVNLSKIFNSLPENRLAEINWKDFDYCPQVYFQMIYSDYAIYIRYTVLEKCTAAMEVQINSPVYKDSCVEFFVAPGDGKYYNFEFNCIGTKYGGCGIKREDNKTLPNKIVDKIRTFSTLGRNQIKEIQGDGINTKWQLIVEIPFEVFTYRKIDEIKDYSMRANFYKCGDELSIPHYLSWNKIKTTIPDFHRPEFFGEIKFE